MNKLIVLELKRNSLRPYHIAVWISGAVILGFQYLLAAIPHIDSTESDIEMFSRYDALIGMSNIICMAVFAVLAAVMGARFVVEEYTGKRAVLLFSYPVSRRRIFGAKLALIFLYPALSMVLCSGAAEVIFFITETMFPLCGDKLTLEVVFSSFGSILCNAVLAGMLGLLSLWIGLFKKSVPVTIVAAVIGASLVCQVLSAAVAFRPVGAIVFIIAAVLTACAVKNMIDQIENMEV